jgi:NitT/TauT family transport system permease protein
MAMTHDLQARSDVLVDPAVDDLGEVRSSARRFSSRQRSAALSLGIFLLFLLIWQGIVRIFNVSIYIMPAPTDLARRLVDEFKFGPASIYGDIWTTVHEMLLGYVIAAVLGLFIGLAMARIPGLERVAYPYVFALQAIPMVALAPVLIIWFGFGITSKVLIVALCAFFPMMVSSLTAFKSVDAGQEQLFQALCASRTRTFLKLRVPSALPFLLAGLDLSLVHSLVGAIVAEFVSGQSGLGVRLLTYNSQVDVTGSFARSACSCTACWSSSVTAAWPGCRRRSARWAASRWNRRAASRWVTDCSRTSRPVSPRSVSGSRCPASRS